MRFKCLWCLWRKKCCLVYLTYNTTDIVLINKKETNKLWKITVHYRCYLFVEEFLKWFCSAKCSNFLLKLNLFHLISMARNQMTLPLIRCYLSLMRYMKVLMWRLKLQASSYIYLEHLIRCDKMVSSSI